MIPKNYIEAVCMEFGPFAVYVSKNIQIEKEEGTFTITQKFLETSLSKEMLPEIKDYLKVMFGELDPKQHSFLDSIESVVFQKKIMIGFVKAIIARAIGFIDGYKKGLEGKKSESPEEKKDFTLKIIINVV